MRAAAEAGPSADPWLDVTVAMQYQVNEHCVTLAPGVSKANLLGFADLAPGGIKALHVVFWCENQLYSIEGAPPLTLFNAAMLCASVCLGVLWARLLSDKTLV